MNQKGFANIVLVVVIVLIAGMVGYFAFVKKSASPTNIPPQNSIANNGVASKPFISPSQKIIDSNKEIEFTFSASKEAIQSKVYLSCESGMVAYFSDNITPRTPTPYPNICNTWQENRWDTVQPDPNLVRDIRDIKFRNDSTQGKVATLQMTVTTPNGAAVKSDLARITINPALTISSSGTVGWKKFTHSRDGYSLKYPSDKVGEPQISSAGDSGSGWIWSAQIGYPDRLGAFADFFTFNGLIDGSIDAYYKGNSRIQITSTQSTTVNGKQAKIVLWRDINNSQSPVGKQYFIQYSSNKVLIVSGSTEALFDQVVSTLQF